MARIRSFALFVKVLLGLLLFPAAVALKEITETLKSVLPVG